VQLPSKPNGSTGWVLASQTKVYPVSSRIVVDLSSRRARLYAWGSLALNVRVAIGAPATPTPIGRFYVNERFVLDTPNGPFGVAALGISAHSDVLRDWVEGGPIALHGTSDTSSIGQAASHGCVRFRNADVRRLLELAPAGTPVVIRR
jgi:lipoprotein-anchoring transpeptidase ErfK/SrfK